MFDKIVADLLTTYLGEYFDNIDREQVKVSIWNGRVHLHNLTVRKDALRFFDVPICVLMGTIEELTVVIPWTHLRSESVVVQIRNARLILSDKETALYDVDQEKREERARKERELRAADAQLLQAYREAQRTAPQASPATAAAADANADANSSDSNFTARLKASILNNIRVEVKQLFVHYTSSVARATRTDEDKDAEDALASSSASQSHDVASPTANTPLSTSESTRQASVSFQIHEMKTCGCNERFEPAFVAPGERMSRQLISFIGLAVSLRTGARRETELPLLRPFNVSLELAYQPVVIDPSTPQYMIALHLDESCACVMTSESCTTCYELLRFLRHVRARQGLRRLRPVGERPTQQPRRWWRYVLDAVQQQVRHARDATLASAHKPTPFSWLTYTETKAKRDRYVGLYLRRQRVALGAGGWLEPLNVDEHVEMVALEEELSTEMLKLAKRLAMERASVERKEYDRLLGQQQRKAAAGAAPPSKAASSASPAGSALTKTSTAVQAPNDGASSSGGGGWFSFWRSAPQQPGSNSGGGAGTADGAGGVVNDGLDDETRAELRELVQLMTAEKWTDAQRAVIAREFGMSAEEAKELAQPGGSNSSSSVGATSGEKASSAGSSANASQRLRPAPGWVVFVRAVSVSLELRSCKAESRALHSVSATTQDTLAKLQLGKLQGGAEWGSNSGSAANVSAEAALPLAYYWGSVELFAITAAKLGSGVDKSASAQAQQQQQQTLQQQEQEILTIRHPQAARATEGNSGSSSAARQSASPLATRRTVPDTATRRSRPFSPLEACWSILSDECRRTAAWQCEWRQRSPQQLTSRACAVHRVAVRLAPLNLVVDVVPLRHLADFFLTVMWPSAEAQKDDNAPPSASPPASVSGRENSKEPGVRDDFLTALHMPKPRPLTHIEQRCAADHDARLIILRRKVERQHSVEWDVCMDCVTVLLSEVPEVQGCELVMKNVRLRNDIAHRLQRQERLQSHITASEGDDKENEDVNEGTSLGTGVLGSSETDWFDYTHVEVGSTSLSVFLPTKSVTSSQDRDSAPATALKVVRQPILANTPFAVVVERSLLGRCHPAKPPYKLHVSSTSAVQLSWSRSTLSVLATSCSTLTDLAASVGETVLQRGGVAATPEGGEASKAVSTFHVGVMPHLTRRAYWRSAEEFERTDQREVVEPKSGDEASATIDNPDLFYKQMHPFSATRLATTTASSTAAVTTAAKWRTDEAKRRVDIRQGACVLYHPNHTSFPAEYYTLRDGCTRVRCTEEKNEDGSIRAAYVHLYVSQGGTDQEAVVTSASDAAELLLMEQVGVPSALLHNAVWLTSAVRAWMADAAARDSASLNRDGSHGKDKGGSAVSVAEVQRALELVLRRSHLVPCRYVAFCCATLDEARRMEVALRQCCVASSVLPLELTPDVQAAYNAAVVAPELRKQPQWSAQVDFPSLQMTCEGREPADCCDELSRKPPLTTGSATTVERRDAVLAFTPFALRYDRFAEKQRFELTVAHKTEMYANGSTAAAATSADTQESDKVHDSGNVPRSSAMPVKLPLLKIAPRAASPTLSAGSPSASPSLFLRFVTYQRPQPLPSLKRCGVYVDAASPLKVRVGPAMFDWAEAWWDSFGLLTNRLFAEEVIAGYPWWPFAPSNSADGTDPWQAARAAEAAWNSTEECGGQALSIMVDFAAPAIEVEVALPQPTDPPTTPAGAAAEEAAVMRFAARDATLQWRLTEGLNSVRLSTQSPAMQWRPLVSAATASSASWVTVIDATASTPQSDCSKLTVQWKLHKAPPMLSPSDWWCSSSSSSSAADAQPSLGFRDRQEMEMVLGGVTMLYWHPLLMHMIQVVQDAVLRRGVTIVNREPCWFHNGVLYSPPLTWPPPALPATPEVSWDRLRKSVTLHRVALQMPGDVLWMDKAGRGAPVSPACAFTMDDFTYTDQLHGVAATDDVTSLTQRSRYPCLWSGAEQAHLIDFRGMALQRCGTSTMLSPSFNALFPSWTFTLSIPVFQASSVLKEGEAWHKKFHVCFRSGVGSGAQPEQDANATTATTTSSWKGTVDDLAVALNLLHANYVAGSAANNAHDSIAEGVTAHSLSSTQQQFAGTESTSADASPATLLKSVVETSTWELDVAALFSASVTPSDLSPSACQVDVSGAHAVMARSGAGELSCTLELSQLSIKSGAKVKEGDTPTEQCELASLLCFPASADTDSVSPLSSSPALLKVQYGWRWLVESTPADAAGQEKKSGSTTPRAMYASCHSSECVCVTADGVAVSHLQSILRAPSLQDSLSRYSAPATPMASTPAAVTQPATSSIGWEKIAVKAQLAQLAFQLPCPFSTTKSATPGKQATSACDLRLCVLTSAVTARLRSDAAAWRGQLHVGRLIHCTLQDRRGDGGAVNSYSHRSSSAQVTITPLLLEQPSGWGPPVAASSSASASPRVTWRAATSPSPTRFTPQRMEAPRPAQSDMLDELFGELPSPVSTASPLNATQPCTQAESPASPSFSSQSEAVASSSSSSPLSAERCLEIEFTHSPAKSSFATTLRPLWLLTPSMPHLSLLLAGLRQQLGSIAAALRTRDASSPPPASVVTAPRQEHSGAFAINVHVGAVSVFVLQKEVTMEMQHGCDARQVEAAVKRSVGEGDALLVATEAVIAEWDSELAATRDAHRRPAVSSAAQTVLQLRNTSICALRGLQQCTVLLERFGVRVTRQVKTRNSGSAAVEEWKLTMDPLQLTLTQFHYAALLRLAFQQTSFLATLMSSAATASQTLAAAAAENDGGAVRSRTSSPPQHQHQHQQQQPVSSVTEQANVGLGRSFRVQVASLSLRVEEDGDSREAVKQPAAVTAVYVQLEQFDATYCTGAAAAAAAADSGKTQTNSRTSTSSMRVAVSLQSCFVGTEGAIPTISLVAPDSADSTTPACVVHISDDDVTGAKRGKVHVKQVTVTVEAIPVMAWVDLLYAPYLQIAVPDYQTSKELVVQRDLWLTDDLVLTERTPLRAVNKSYSLLYLYGNGHTIYLNAARRGHLLLLEEGMTLHITHAVVCMEAESIEAYVSAGNGSYVVLNRETCTVVRPSEAAAAAAAQQDMDDLFFAAGSVGQQSKPATLSGPATAAPQQPPAIQWTEFEGDVQAQLRIPEPRPTFAATPAASPVTGSPAAAATAATAAQRTLVLYSDMRLSLVNAAASALAGENEVSGSFVLAHAGVRSEFVTAHGVTVSTADLISDWAMTVQYTEEKSLAQTSQKGLDFYDDTDAGSPLPSTSRRVPATAPRRRCVQHVRNIFLDASTGVEMRVQYSDVFFVLRAARHAQAAFAKWKDAVRRDLWSSLTALPRSWDVEEVEGDLVKESLIRDRSSTYASVNNSRSSRAPSSVFAAASPHLEDSVTTRTAVSVQIPYVSFFAVDDSQNTDTPLFCLYVNEIHTPSVLLESPHVKAELQFTLQLDYYELAQSQWAPVLDPLRVNLALNWRRNMSVLDVYNRQGYVRLAVHTASVRSYFTLGLLRNVRQLQLLRAKFEAAGLEEEVEKARANAAEGTAGSIAPAASFHAFNLQQTTGVDIVARLPEYVSSAARSSGNDTIASSSSTSARVLASGESWAFNLPRAQGKELPRSQQKIMLQQQHSKQSKGGNHPCTEADESRGAVVSLASVGVQRACLSTAGPLQRYVVADVSVPPQQQGQKQVHLHSTILFRNRLSVDLVQLALNGRGAYDVVDVVPAGAAQHVSVEALRRRVCLAVVVPDGAGVTKAASEQQRRTLALSPDAVVALGVSYDALPCLINDTFLCVSAVPSVADGRGATAAATPQTRLAKGKNFDIYSGKESKSYFLLRVQAAAEQPADVRRYAALAPLRSVVVSAEAAVTVHNAVGVPLTLTLLTRRVRPGMRIGLLDTAPDTAVYTAVHATTLAANASYGATEMDPLDDVCVGVALQQPNGSTLLQWSSQLTAAGGVADGAGSGYYPPACIYTGSGRGRRDGQLVLMDPATGSTLVLYIKYTKGLVTLYCPHWIVNETQMSLQFADTSSPHVGATDRSANPIAGLGGRTVRSATVPAWDGAALPPEQAQQQQQSNVRFIAADGESDAANTSVFLYNSLRAESCSKNKSNAGTNGLFVRVWETATGDANEAACFSDWSTQALSVHEIAEVQVVTCASRRVRGTLLVLSCRVELGSQTNLHAYSDTRVIYVRPRWVLMNKSPYTLCFSQIVPGVRRSEGGDATLARVKPFSDITVPSVASVASEQGGQVNPMLSFAISDDVQHNVQQCRWSYSLPINVVHEESINLVYHSLIPMAEYWPQSSADTPSAGKQAAQRIPDSLPPLNPEDIKEIKGELFVDREEAKVFTTTAYAYKGCMMCVEVEEAAQPPIVVENRTSFTVCFQQRGVRRISTVFPRCRKAWTWDAPTSGVGTPATVELWLAQAQEASSSGGATSAGRRGASTSPAASGGSNRATCVLNFDPQLVGQQSRNAIGGFQQEIEVVDPVHGTPSMLFVRVRGVHGLSYAVSITTEPTIDAYRTLPYPQLSLALQVESVYALLCGEGAEGVLLCGIQPLSFAFAQGIRRRRDGASAAEVVASGDAENGDTDVQRLQLRFHAFQVDDERAAAKERVVAQLVDDRESGFQIERKLLRTTPILYCSVAAFRLAPIELHVEDGFITAMMGYQEVVHNTWDLARAVQQVNANTAAARLNVKAGSGTAAAAVPPWKADLAAALTVARHVHAEIEENTQGTLQSTRVRRAASAPLWSRVVAIEQLSVDPILVSLSLYRSPGAADDPLWKIAGAASLLVGSTQDARLQWDAVQRRRVCDTIWHLFFVHRDAYRDQMKKQYMSLVNVMGLDTMRNFVSDLLNAYSDEPRGGSGGGSGNRGAVRRQKPRQPLRRTAQLCLDQPKEARSRVPRAGSHGAAASPTPDAEAATEAEALTATTTWLQQVRDRPVPVNAQRTVTVAEVARSYQWSAFLSVAQPGEVRAFGALALARCLAEMPTTPRYAQTSAEGTARRVSAQEVVTTSTGAPRVQCTRCVELEALRLQRMRDGAATPLPHPIKDGFLTWEEFAHHINWYEFVDMCSDDEVCKYASLVRAGACEASSNVCILT